MPKDSVPISESGLHTYADLEFLSDGGYRGFLIGETLMCADNPEKMLRKLRNIK
jgi:indole-3-glycerol phosphate synthase